MQAAAPNLKDAPKVRRLHLLAAVPRNMLFDLGIAKEGDIQMVTPYADGGSATLAQLDTATPGWLTTFEDAMVWRTREAIEKDTSLVHFIPYLIVHDEKGQVFHYQRTKKIGESKLAGNRSIGLGGHMDVTPMVAAHIYSNYQSNTNPFINAINAGLSAELHEELDVGELPLHSIVGLPVLRGMLYDDRDVNNGVGRVHLGLVFTIQIDTTKTDGWSFVACKEPELTTLEPLRYDANGLQTTTAFETELEPWSAYLSELMPTLLPHKKLLTSGVGNHPTYDSINKEKSFMSMQTTFEQLCGPHFVFRSEDDRGAFIQFIPPTLYDELDSKPLTVRIRGLENLNRDLNDAMSSAWMPNSVARTIDMLRGGDAADYTRFVDPRDYWQIAKIAKAIAKLTSFKRGEKLYLTKGTSPRQVPVTNSIIISHISADKVLEIYRLYQADPFVRLAYEKQCVMNRAAVVIGDFWSHITDELVKGNVEFYEGVMDIYREIHSKVPLVQLQGIDLF